MLGELAVVVPLYAIPENNRARYFAENTLPSILAQNYDFTLVIVNDNPRKDLNIREISGNDPRIFLIDRKKHQGEAFTSAGALNDGFNLAYGAGCRYFAYVYSDDILPPNSLEGRVDILKHTDAKMVYARSTKFDGNKFCDHKEPFDPTDRGTENLEKFPHHSSMWSREMIASMLAERGQRIFDLGLRCCEDLDVSLYSLNVAERHGLKLGYLDRLAYIWVSHPEQITCRLSRNLQFAEEARVFRKNGFGGDLYYHSMANPILRLLLRPGYFLPERTRKQFRGIKSRLRKATGNRMFPGGDEVDNEPSLNPYWFKESARKET